jgi:hypothetical protein
LNKKYGGNVPKADVTLFFDELAFGLDDTQYRDAILMVDLFHANLKKQKVAFIVNCDCDFVLTILLVFKIPSRKGKDTEKESKGILSIRS